MNSAVNIRKAVPEDSAQLAEICKRSFPLSLRWQAKRWLARQWWNAILYSEAVDTWVVEDGGKVTTVCVLVTNEPVWAKEKEISKPSIMIGFLSVLCHPIVALYQAGQCLNTSLRHDRLVITSQQLPDWWSHTERLWLELIAVVPNMKGRGFASMLLNHSIKKSKELGRRAIALRVASENLAAKRLYEKHGFIRYQSDAEGDLYVKFINS